MKRFLSAPATCLLFGYITLFCTFICSFSIQADTRYYQVSESDAGNEDQIILETSYTHFKHDTTDGDYQIKKKQERKERHEGTVEQSGIVHLSTISTEPVHNIKVSELSVTLEDGQSVKAIYLDDLLEGLEDLDSAVPVMTALTEILKKDKWVYVQVPTTSTLAKKTIYPVFIINGEPVYSDPETQGLPIKIPVCTPECVNCLCASCSSLSASQTDIKFCNSNCSCCKGDHFPSATADSKASCKGAKIGQGHIWDN